MPVVSVGRMPRELVVPLVGTDLKRPYDCSPRFEWDHQPWNSFLDARDSGWAVSNAQPYRIIPTVVERGYSMAGYNRVQIEMTRDCPRTGRGVRQVAD